MAAFQFDTKGLYDPIFRAQEAVSGSLKNLGGVLGRRKQRKWESIEAEKERGWQEGIEEFRAGKEDERSAANRIEARNQAALELAETIRSNMSREDIARSEAAARSAEAQAEADYRRDVLAASKEDDREPIGLAELGRIAWERAVQESNGTYDVQRQVWTLPWASDPEEYQIQAKNIMFFSEAYIKNYLRDTGLSGGELESEVQVQMEYIKKRLADEAPTPETPEPIGDKGLIGRLSTPEGSQAFSEGTATGERVMNEIPAVARAAISPFATLGYGNAAVAGMGDEVEGKPYELGEPNANVVGSEVPAWRALQIIANSGLLNPSEIGVLKSHAQGMQVRAREDRDLPKINQFIEDMKQKYGLWSTEDSSRGF